MQFEHTIAELKNLISKNNDEIIKSQCVLDDGNLSYKFGKDGEKRIKNLKEITKDHEDAIEYLSAIISGRAPSFGVEETIATT